MANIFTSDVHTYVHDLIAKEFGNEPKKGKRSKKTSASEPSRHTMVPEKAEAVDFFPGEMTRA